MPTAGAQLQDRRQWPGHGRYLSERIVVCLFEAHRVSWRSQLAEGRKLLVAIVVLVIELHGIRFPDSDSLHTSLICGRERNRQKDGTIHLISSGQLQFEF